MQYIMLLYADEKAGAGMPADDMAAAMQVMGAYADSLSKAGAFVMTSPLALTRDARTVRMEGGQIAQKAPGHFVREGGEMTVHDGPYAETREQLGGIYIIEAKSMAEALEWAEKCPAAQWGSIEVRAMLAGA